MTELKPCPFCGGRGYFERIDMANTEWESFAKQPRYWYCVCCKKCRLKQPGYYRSKDEAIRLWNRRVKE
jgi:predicted nucleic-acid-binding Zn-ribbon protein